jgi:hypothetical protein
LWAVFFSVENLIPASDDVPISGCRTGLPLQEEQKKILQAARDHGTNDELMRHRVMRSTSVATGGLIWV